jgi:heat shock protein HslJ
MNLMNQQLHRQRPFTWLLPLLLTLILAACAAPTGEPGVDALPTDIPPVSEATSDTEEREVTIDWAVADLTDGPVWQLVQYGPVEKPTQALEETTITLSFEQEDHLSGSSGCNSYSGSYELDGRSITIGPLGSTRMACLNDGIMEQETAFVQAMESAHSLSLIEDRLTIVYDEGELHFVPQEAPQALPLEGTEWRLQTAVTFHNEVMSALPVPGDLDVTLLLEDGQLGGFNGCNSYGGSYTLENGELDIDGDSLIQTLIACIDDIPNQLESQMMTGLREMESYDITGEQLTITYPDGELIFTPKTAPEALPLEGTEWYLETAVETDGDTVSALPVPNGLAVTLLLEGGQLGGFNGCNSFGGNYTLEEGHLRIDGDSLNQTMIACLDNIEGELETQMMTGLRQMASYNITGDQLTITYSDGELIFVGHK